MAGLEVKDDKLLGRIAKKVRERKLKKKLATVPEIKAAYSPPEVRRFVLKQVAALNCKIYALAVDKKRVVPELMAEPNRLYNWLCRVLCQQVEGKEVKIVIDKKYSKLLLADFNDYLKRELLKRGITAIVEHRESHACLPLQAVDFVAWAVNRKYSHDDGSYYELIRPK
ncbi:MAG: DUF3800 domain-containing protein [Candidatus Micrarchaeia archaeon]